MTIKDLDKLNRINAKISQLTQDINVLKSALETGKSMHTISFLGLNTYNVDIPVDAVRLALDIKRGHLEKLEKVFEGYKIFTESEVGEQ